MKDRPRIRIAPTSSDQKIDIIIIVMTILLVAIPLVYYFRLPDIIPVHFDGASNIDGFGPKVIIWVIPIIGLLTYFSLRYLMDKPHLYNYPTTVTQENAEGLYRSGVKMMRYLLLITQLTYLIIVGAVLYAALHPGKNILGPWFFISILLISVLAPIVMAYKMSNK